MSKGEQAIAIAVIGASATIAVALVSALSVYFAAKRDRRRTLYSEAVRSVVAWKEQLYRVRRRQENQEAALVAGFHTLQDQLTYYEAWIGSESESMKRSFDKFVREVKSKTESLITSAWNEPLRSPPGNAKDGDEHPDISAQTAAFLKDVRSHLSPWPWRKLAVRYRNRKGAKG